MNLSLKSRVAFSFGITTIIVLLLTFVVFNFLNSLNKDIETITGHSHRVSLLTEEARITTVSLLKYQGKLFTDRIRASEHIKRMNDLCESFTIQLHNLDSFYSDPEIKKVFAKMLSYVDSLKIILSKSSLFHRDTAGVASIVKLVGKIMDAFMEFQDIQYLQSVKGEEKIKLVISETKKNMMITLIIGFLGTIILGLMIPGKIALPFKKIKDAIRELQECNLDVSIYYNQDDEIGEIAAEMNKMIVNIKSFDDLRKDRISLENRKFNALANMVNKPVLVADAEGKLRYMNNRLYSLLQVQSEDVIDKIMSEPIIPNSIIECYKTAIKRRSKIDNAEISISKKIESKDDLDKISTEISPKKLPGEKETAKATKESEKVEILPEIIFKGYANVIPIRGKESSLDYYIMVLSTEAFV